MLETMEEMQRGVSQNNKLPPSLFFYEQHSTASAVFLYGFIDLFEMWVSVAKS